MAFRGERYETLRVIASGGMATVHLGRALGAGGFERLVAIKVMHPHLAGEPEFVAMFLDEARLAARIRHPNVVSTLDVQADDDGVFLVMDYVEGPSLQQVFRALGKSAAQLPLDIFLRIFLDTLAGLHAAHELRDASDRPLHLVHRDVSPQNILIGADGIGRITDFGVASAEARLSSTHGGQLKGKLGYMSPEQSRSEPVDRRTDIYAAGVILWEVLAGGRRFRAGNEAAVLKVLAEGAVRPLRELNPFVPEALEACCLRALARDASERFATAADFAEATEKAAVLGGIGVASTRAVATFVTELQAHERPVDLPAAPPQSARASLVFANSQRRSLPEIPAAAADSSLPPTSPELRRSASERSQPSMSPAPLASEASIPPALPPRRSSRKLFLGLGAAICIATIAIVLLGRRDSNGPAAGGQTPAEAPARAAVIVPSAEPTAIPSSPAPAEPPVATIAPTGATIAASSRVTPAIATAPTPITTARAATPAPSVSARASGGDKPAQVSPVYRPPDL